MKKQKDTGDGLTDSQQFELDRLSAKIKQEDTFRQVTHVVIHRDIFDAIMEKWYIEEYKGDNLGDTGHNNCYHNIYFKELKDSIPEYIRRVQEFYIKVKKEAESDPSLLWFVKWGRKDLFKWDDVCLAGQWMSSFERGSGNSVWGLINVNEHIDEYIEKDDWNGLALFLNEVLTAAWINAFMSYTRKIWTKQSGQGSQNNEPVGYRVLANAVLDVLKAEKENYDAINAEDEDSQLDLFRDNE